MHEHVAVERPIAGSVGREVERQASTWGDVHGVLQGLIARMSVDEFEEVSV